MGKQKRLYADAYDVMYRWPDETEWHEGYVVHTNIDDHEEAAFAVGIDDEDIVAYTDTLDEWEIKKNFDGLEVDYSGWETGWDQIGWVHYPDPPLGWKFDKT